MATIPQQNQQMSMTNPHQQRFPMPPNHMSSQVQQRSMLMRQGPNQPQLNSAPTNPAAVPIQGMPFAATMMHQQPQGPNAATVRRVQSQPHMNPLGAPIPNQVSPAMQLAMNQQSAMPPQIRQAASQQNQLRMHQAQMMQTGLTNDIGPLGMPRQPANPAMQQGVARTASGQPPMSSLPQPPMGGPSSIPAGMQQSHHQNSFPGSTSIPPQHQPPPISSSPRPPQGYNPSQFPGGNPGRPGPPGSAGGPQSYGFAPSPTPPMPVGEVSQPSPSGMMQGGAPNRANFSAQGSQFDMMGNNEVYPNFGMHPPTTVPPRPPSMGGPHQPPGGQSQASQNMLQAQSQQNQQQNQQSASQQPSNPQLHNQQLQPPQQQPQQTQPSQSHQSSPRADQMNPHPQRPQSQPRHSTPGRPPSQAGAQRNAPGPVVGPGPGSAAGANATAGNAIGGPSQPPRTMGPVGIGAPLTGVGRIQQPAGPSAGGLPAIAPRPGPGGMPAQNAQGGPGLIGGAPPNGVGDVAPPPLFRPMGSVNQGTGQAVLRLLQFSGVLASENKTKLQLSYWNDLVKEYFTPKAIMKLTLWKDNQRNEAKPFEIGVPILPRFFLVTTQSGVKSMTLSLDGARERQFGQGHYVVECVAAIWTYKYTNGYIVTLRGPLTAHVLITLSSPPGQPQTYTFKFEELQFDANFHDKYIALDSIAGKRSIDGRRTPPGSDEGSSNSPAQSASGQSSQSQQHKWEEPRIMLEGASIPGEPVNAFGIPQATMRCLELAESVSSMADLITFANETGLGPQGEYIKTYFL
ncbi:hypothetical protein CVT24_009095 [Panaeolus cyanescens]|uniref:Uncharacterized protein n=1 Tax=Panaeolus cyanescens TaxID=181874 RepID=A0A409VAP6_9AGAR|nr:hypothetical protein CVT24_009095 [Panaeolus cyanescens]